MSLLCSEMAKLLKRKAQLREIGCPSPPSNLNSTHDLDYLLDVPRDSDKFCSNFQGRLIFTATDILLLVCFNTSACRVSLDAHLCTTILL